MAQHDQQLGSMLLVEECFERADRRFVGELRRLGSLKPLAAFAAKWLGDSRPWARQQLLEYLDLPFDEAGHQGLIKRLFKGAEQRRDVELMGAIVVACDRLVRRQRRVRWRWDQASRQSFQEEELYAPRNAIASPVSRSAEKSFVGKAVTIPPGRAPKNGRLFRYRTRYYLRRRAWRFFRWLRYSEPTAYVPAVSTWLARYRDEDLAKGEDLLECWGLMQACYRKHPAVRFGATTIRVRDGHSLAELTPAAAFPELWQSAEAFDSLWQLVTAARSRLMRMWTIEMLRHEHRSRLDTLPPEKLLALFDHDDQEVQQFGAELLESSTQLATLPIETWLRLLTVESPTVLATICDAMAKHVSPDRLTLAQCVDVACAAPTPVARLGFSFLQHRRIESADDRRIVSRLASAKCAATSAESTAWALGLFHDVHYELELVSPFFDSLLLATRNAAWNWLIGEPDSLPHPLAFDDPALWSRLLESPFDDIRLRLIDELQRRERLPGSSRDELAPLWCSVLLGVHRGGRQKQKATAQIARAVAERPDRAASLLPVLVVAVRSTRPSERRAGLAAIVQAVAARPELAATVTAQISELRFVSAEVG